jgi:hypothetical protein
MRNRERGRKEFADAVSAVNAGWLASDWSEARMLRLSGWECQ